MQCPARVIKVWRQYPTRPGGPACVCLKDPKTLEERAKEVRDLWCKPNQMTLSCGSNRCEKDGNTTASPMDTEISEISNTTTLNNLRCNRGETKYCYLFIKDGCTWEQPCKPVSSCSSSSSSHSSSNSAGNSSSRR